MALLVALELFTLIFAMNTLTAVRGFVGGEGIWSKGQKSAIYRLQQYLFSNRSSDYEKFKSALTVPLGDRDVRVELLKENYDANIVEKGFANGEIHEKDRPHMIKLVRRFHEVPVMATVLATWAAGDVKLAELVSLGEKIHSEVSKGIDKNK